MVYNSLYIIFLPEEVMKRIRLNDGIYLNIIKSDKFKTEYFDLNIILPLREQTASYAALLPLVIKRGSKAYPNMAEISKRLDYLYSTGFSARVTKRGETQIIGFLTDFLRESLVPAGENLSEKVFTTIRDIIFEPYTENGAFKTEYVETEKKNLCDEIEALINNKRAYSMKKCYEAMCEGQNYAVSEKGSVELVQKIDGKSLYDFYKELLSSSRIEMFYTGTLDEQNIVSLVNRLVDGIERKSVAPISTEKFVRTRSEILEVTEEMEIAQGNLILGFASDHTLTDDDCTAYSLFCELYGGSPSSKLFENVREKLSLCYFCRSIVDSHKGILTVASGIEVENRDRAMNEILAQLENTRNGIISDEELDAAKKSMTNAYRELYDDGTSLASWYLSRLIGGSEKTVEDVISEISKVTKEQIADCAKATQLDTVYFLKGTMKSGGED
jgi:predicted Zn-dependent peptidase